LFLALPAPQFGDLPKAARGRLAEALGVESSGFGHAASIDVGSVWWTVQLSSAEDVLALRPDMEKLRLLMPGGHTGVTVFGAYGPGMGSDVEVRSFAPGEGVPEDPVCGSGNGCVAALVQRHRLIASDSYAATQGRCLDRDGRIAVRFDADGTIWVGGHAVTCIEGSLRL
jgi:PhzF family phenazine biosynthesis protein